MKKIYLDNAASTPVDERVVKTMLPYFSEKYGNPSSMHYIGNEAFEVLNQARIDIAKSLNAQDGKIIFTSSGTESNNFALKGFAFANRKKGNHIIISAIEHDCIINSCKWLQSQGFDVTYLSVNNDGLIDLNQLKECFQPNTIMVSIMHANNEIGVIEPIEEIGNLCREYKICFHTDACQSFGKIPVDVEKMNIDMATINAHKIYGPKGAGALYIRNQIKIMPWQHGGGHEFGLRSATENIPGIAGFAKAAELCIDNLSLESSRLQILRDRIIDTVMNEVPSAYLNGHRHLRLPNNINIAFNGLEGQAPNLLMALNENGVSVSTGSACSSNNKKSSHVLTAIGRNPVQAIGALRVTLGRFTASEDIDYFLSVLLDSIKKLQPIWSR